MSWQDILKKPYDVGEYDGKFDSEAEIDIDKILEGKFDNLAQRSQVKTKKNKFSVLMDNETYDDCLRTVRGDKKRLAEIMTRLYKVRKVQIIIGDNKIIGRKQARRERMRQYDSNMPFEDMSSEQNERLEEWTKDVEGWEESGKESIDGAVKVVFTKL